MRIYRVDNPHTKPLDFWNWMIREVQQEFPDAIFLAEAFTRPKVMKALAKAGFTQSYTYFTWRNERTEIEEYLTEITQPPVAEYFRGNLFINTPDIAERYSEPRLLWLLCPLLLYWISRLWLKTGRGEMHDDPIVFTVRDRGSRYVIAIATLIVLLAMKMSF